MEISVARFSVRFTPGSGPNSDLVEVDAAMFLTEGDFVDFYSKGTRNIGGYLSKSGDIVRRIRSDFILEIVEIPES
jgi:hypothetical protein